MNSQNKTYKSIWYILGFVLNSCLGGFFFGYSLGELNLLQIDLEKQYNWNNSTSNIMKGLLNALVPIGALIGTVLAGNFFSNIGRKWSLIIADILGIIGCCICIILGAGGTPQIIGRLLCGISVGINSQIVPLYINELSPVEVSGAMGTFFQSFINIGILLSYVMGWKIPDDDKGSYDINDKWWMFVFTFPLITCVLRLLLLLLVYNFDTPFSLMKRKKNEELNEVMKKIYLDNSIEEVLENIKKKIEDYKDVSYKQIAKVYTNRLIVGLLLMATQQLCGINAVVTDSSTLYSHGFDKDTVKIFTIINSVILLISALISGKIADLKGRRFLLMTGTLFCCILLLIMGILLEPSWNSDTMDIIAIVLTMMFLFCFGVSLGPVAWFYEPEILPEKGVSLCTLTNWIFCGLVVFLTPILIDLVGISVIYYFFCGCCFLSVVYMQFMLKETKGKTAYEIDEIFGTKIADADDGSKTPLCTDQDSKIKV